MVDVEILLNFGNCFRPLQLESNYLKFSVVPCTRGVFPGILPGSVPASNLPVLVHGHGNQEISQEKIYIPFKFITRFVSFGFLMGLKSRSINLSNNIIFHRPYLNVV